MLDSKRDIDIKNRLLDSEGDGKGFSCSSLGKKNPPIMQETWV